MPAKRYCCVIGCNNSEQNSRQLTFYSFPKKSWEIDRRNKWIQAIRRITADGKPWQPNISSRICSAHFVGGKQSSIENSPSYTPTIFPPIYKKKALSQAAVARHDRLRRRNQKSKTQKEVLKPKEQQDSNLENDIDMGSGEILEIPEKVSISCQTDFCEEEDNSPANILFCYQNEKNEASTQTNIRIWESKTNERVIVNNLKTVKTTSCGPDEIMNYGFTGFSDIKTDKTMTQLGGVSLQFFSVLLSLVTVKEAGQPFYYKVLSKENRLLLFLMKMKLGVSFCALASLFNIHTRTASKIFFEMLTTLTLKTKTWIFWPSKESIRENLPPAFRKYPNCRCIIDCTEIFTETPPTVEQRVLMYSNYKSRFTVKFLIAITPDGFISKLSKGYGGRATDSFMTNDSGLLQLIEPGDTVLADKGFPQIKSELLKREAVLVIPPFAFDPQFSNEDVEETYKIASVRIHVERAIQRMKLCNILKLIPVELLPHIDSIMHMCCIIANSKPPLIKTEVTISK